MKRTPTTDEVEQAFQCAVRGQAIRPPTNSPPIYTWDEELQADVWLWPDGRRMPAAPEPTAAARTHEPPHPAGCYSPSGE